MPRSPRVYASPKSSVESTQGSSTWGSSFGAKIHFVFSKGPRRSAKPTNPDSARLGSALGSGPIHAASPGPRRTWEFCVTSVPASNRVAFIRHDPCSPELGVAIIRRDSDGVADKLVDSFGRCASPVTVLSPPNLPRRLPAFVKIV